MKRRNFSYGGRALNRTSPVHSHTIKEPTARRGERPVVTVEPTSDEEVALRLKHEADAIRRLTREVLPLVSDIAGGGSARRARSRAGGGSARSGAE
jgi:hypothetical protein